MKKVPTLGSRIFLDNVYIAKALTRIIYLDIPRITAKQGVNIYKDFSIPPAMTKRFKLTIEELIELIRADGVEPTLMTLNSIMSPNMSTKAIGLVHYPVWTNDPLKFLSALDIFNKVIIQIAEDKKIKLIDIAKHFNKLEDKEQYFFDTMHNYCSGYEEMAKFISKSLIYSLSKDKS